MRYYVMVDGTNQSLWRSGENAVSDKGQHRNNNSSEAN